MSVVIHSRVVLDHCVDHGMCLDRGEREQLERAGALRSVLDD
jgi:hypothetical protein